MNIKKIILTEIEDFDWISNINPIGMPMDRDRLGSLIGYKFRFWIGGDYSVDEDGVREWWIDDVDQREVHYSGDGGEGNVLYISKFLERINRDTLNDGENVWVIFDPTTDTPLDYYTIE